MPIVSTPVFRENYLQQDFKSVFKPFKDFASVIDINEEMEK